MLSYDGRYSYIMIVIMYCLFLYFFSRHGFGIEILNVCDNLLLSVQDISSNAECEIRNEDLTLYINESGSEYISRRPHELIEKPLSSLEKSKHWKRALQYKNLSNLMKNYIDSLVSF